MKIRNGFVSNSSSSSYIVALKKPTVCPHCGRSDPNLLDLLENHSSYRARVEAIGMEKVISNYCCDHYDDNNKVENKLRKLLAPYNNKKYEIASIEISNHDTPIKLIFKNMVASGSAIIIEGEEG